MNHTKLYLIIAAAAVLLLSAAALTFFFMRDTYDYTLIQRFSFSSKGSMRLNEEEYRLEKTDGKWTAFHSKSSGTGDFEAETVSFEVNDADAQKIIAELKAHRAGRWDGYKKSNKHVKDGTYYYFDAAFSDGRTITAQGYARRPRGYSEARDALIRLFEKHAAEN